MEKKREVWFKPTVTLTPEEFKKYRQIQKLERRKTHSSMVTYIVAKYIEEYKRK